MTNVAAVTSQRTPHKNMEHTRPASRAGEVERWLLSHFGTYPGQICIGSIDGDPSIEDMKQEWFRTTKLHDAALYIEMLEGLGRNIYVAAVRFNGRKRAYATAQKSVWLWIDDVPANFEATERIQTSEHKYQAWLRVDTPLTAEQRSDWQRRIAANIGADQCSADAVHMGRVPFGYNTKKHGKFAVRRVGGTCDTYSLSDLAERFPQIETPQDAPRRTDSDMSANAAMALNQQRLTTLREQIDAPRSSWLKDVDSTVPYIQRVPARVNPGTQTYKILTDGPYRAAFRNKGGSWDASVVRNILVKGLIKRGYDKEQLTAIGLKLEDPGTIEAKGEKAIIDDYARLLGKYKDLYQKCQEAHRQRKARKDRQSKYTPETYYALLCEHQQDGYVALKRKERATLAGISTAALDRLEDVLEQQEYIRIHTSKDRSGSTVELLGGVINIVADTIEPCEESNEQVFEVLSGNISQSPEYATATPENGDVPYTYMEHTTPLPPVGVVELADTGDLDEYATVIRDRFFEKGIAPARTFTIEQAALVLQARCELDKERLDKSTGEMKKWPVTCKRIMSFIQEHHAIDASAWAKRYNDWLKVNIDNFFDTVRKLDDAKLKNRRTNTSSAMRRLEREIAAREMRILIDETLRTDESKPKYAVVPMDAADIQRHEGMIKQLQGRLKVYERELGKRRYQRDMFAPPAPAEGGAGVSHMFTDDEPTTTNTTEQRRAPQESAAAATDAPAKPADGWIVRKFGPSWYAWHEATNKYIYTATKAEAIAATHKPLPRGFLGRVA